MSYSPPVKEMNYVCVVSLMRVYFPSLSLKWCIKDRAILERLMADFTPSNLNWSCVLRCPVINNIRHRQFTWYRVIQKTFICFTPRHYMTSWGFAKSPYAATAVLCQHIETERKWPSFLRRRLQLHFFKLKSKISLKFVPRGAFNNMLAVVQITAWRCSGQ